MDCQMPGMDGYAATEAIREDERRRGTGVRRPSLPCRPTCWLATASAASKSGMDSFLAKPFKSAQLVEALRPIAQARGRVPAAQRAAAGDRTAQHCRAPMTCPSGHPAVDRHVAVNSRSRQLRQRRRSRSHVGRRAGVARQPPPRRRQLATAEPRHRTTPPSMTDTGGHSAAEAVDHRCSPTPPRTRLHRNCLGGPVADLAPARARRRAGAGHPRHRQADDLRASVRNAVRLVP